MAVFLDTYLRPNFVRDTRRRWPFELIGLKETDDRVWNVLYHETLLGRFDERTRTITGAPSLKKDC